MSHPINGQVTGKLSQVTPVQFSERGHVRSGFRGCQVVGPHLGVSSSGRTGGSGRNDTALCNAPRLPSNQAVSSSFVGCFILTHVPPSPSSSLINHFVLKHEHCQTNLKHSPKCLSWVSEAVDTVSLKPVKLREQRYFDKQLSLLIFYSMIF